MPLVLGASLYLFVIQSLRAFRRAESRRSCKVRGKRGQQRQLQQQEQQQEQKEGQEQEEEQQQDKIRYRSSEGQF